MTNDELVEKVIETEQRSKSNTRRINELSEQVDAVNRLATAVEVMAKEQGHQTEALKEVKADLSTLNAKVETIEKKPAKRWESVAEKLITAAAGAVATAIVGALIYLLGVAP